MAARINLIAWERRSDAGVKVMAERADRLGSVERVGRGTYVGAGIPNPLTNVEGASKGTLQNFFSPTNFTGASLLEALPVIRANLLRQRGNPNNTDFSVTNIEVDKQGSVVDGHFPNASSTQAGLGMQREIVHDFVISANFVFRRFDHIAGAPGLVDVNHFSAARGPVLPICATKYRNSPTLCHRKAGPCMVQQKS